jgi:Ser/Thr protein kinase RdoA (MazF antagonist)
VPPQPPHEGDLTAGRVRDTILADLDRQRGEAHRWEVEGPLFIRRDSWLFKARTPAGPGPFAVKVYRPGAAMALRLREHVEAMERLHARMASVPELTVPRPHGAVPEHRAVIMEWLNEPLMRSLLKSACTLPGRRRQLIRRAGRWLAHFHRHSEPIDRPFSAQSLVEPVVKLAKGSTTADPMFARSLAILKAVAPTLEGTPAAHAKVHRDFTPFNLFVGPERTVGIDVFGLVRDCVAADLSRFLVHLGIFRRRLDRLRQPAPTGNTLADYEAFLGGYESGDQAATGKLLLFAHLAFVLWRWAALDRMQSPRTSSPPGQQAVLKHMADHTARALEGAI